MATPETRGKETATVLRKTLKRLVWATVVLYLCLAAVVIKVYLDGKSTTESLCAFRTDLVQRVVQSNQFLKEHPNGTPGIPVKTITDSITNQTRTVLSLKDISCDTAVPEFKAP